MELPTLKIDISQYLSSLGNSFSGEVRDANSKAEMKNKLATYISQLLDEISSRFTTEVKVFKVSLEKIEASFTDELLKTLILNMK